MEDNRQKPGFFVRLATLIVDKRNLFFLLYTAGIIFSLISQGWVQVNNDITDYLPEETETRQGLQLMEDEFTTFGTARVMISNITYENAEELKDVIEAIPGVSSVTFGDQVDEDENTIDADDRDDYYKDSAALYSVTFEGETDDPVSEEAMVQLRETLKDYDLSISSEVGEDGSARLEKEMQSILVVAAITILVVLFLTSRTYGEIPVLLLTFVAAALLNKGTNYLLGEISFISDSIAVVLQLALAIDYAIILCHRFSEEKETADTRTACILALSKAIPEISSSCLTTLAGLAAMMFMQFGIGMDLGVVLIKAVLFSILSVFTLMPGLLMLFSKLIERTPHKSFIPKITVWGRFVTSLKYITPPLFVIAFAAAAYLAGNCPYSYGTNTVKTEKKNETEIARENIDNVFGSQNTLAVVVPAGDYETEERLLKRLSAFPQVDTALGLANVEVKDGYVLTDALTPRQFSELTDMGVEVHFFTGNHDIWCGDYLTKECGVIMHREPLTTEIYGKEFYLAHGDGLGDPDKKFKLLRSMFHSKTLQTLFSALHPRWSVELGLTWAKHSRQKRADGKEPDYMGENQEHLVLYTKEYLKSHPNINFFIYGHRHIELDLMLSTTSRVLILGDWINYFSYAVFDGENLFLEDYIEGETQA